jgi:hypothetical protein
MAHKCNALIKQDSVRTTVDIPAPLASGRSVRELVLACVQRVLLQGRRPRSKRVQFPLIVSPGHQGQSQQRANMNRLNSLDSNVWLALILSRHVHSKRARSWFEGAVEEQFFFCRFTQLTVLRLLTTESVMAKETKTMAEAWAL